MDTVVTTFDFCRIRHGAADPLGDVSARLRFLREARAAASPVVVGRRRSKLWSNRIVVVDHSSVAYLPVGGLPQVLFGGPPQIGARPQIPQQEPAGR
jgi:hypothetical protein